VRKLSDNRLGWAKTEITGGSFWIVALIARSAVKWLMMCRCHGELTEINGKYNNV
jgi:hypothetical protein